MVPLGPFSPENSLKQVCSFDWSIQFPSQMKYIVTTVDGSVILFKQYCINSRPMLYYILSLVLCYISTDDQETTRVGLVGPSRPMI